MSKDRRKLLIRMIEGAAVGLVALDLALYFVAIQPLRNKSQDGLVKFDQERAEIRNEEARVKRLEWYKASMPATEKELNDFMGEQVQGQRKGFTRLARLLRATADDAGVELGPFTFKPEPVRDEPLELVSISLGVSGTFGNLMSFAHSLESVTSDFIVIQDFDFGPGEKETAGNLSLKLSAELYLTR